MRPAGEAPGKEVTEPSQTCAVRTAAFSHGRLLKFKSKKLQFHRT